jgi:hypothetical protein
MSKQNNLTRTAVRDGLDPLFQFKQIKDKKIEEKKKEGIKNIKQNL